MGRRPLHDDRQQQDPRLRRAALHQPGSWDLRQRLQRRRHEQLHLRQRRSRSAVARVTERDDPAQRDRPKRRRCHLRRPRRPPTTTSPDNIVSNSNIRWNAESFWGSGPVGTGNSFHDNCVWATNSKSYYDNQGGVDDPDGFSASANTIGNPQYVNAGAGNYAIPSSSPCAGKGPLTTCGRRDGGSGTPPPPTAPTTTAAATTHADAAADEHDHDEPRPDDDRSGRPRRPRAAARRPPEPPARSAPSPAPTVSALPSIHGTPAVGSWLAATPGRWTARARRRTRGFGAAPRAPRCVPIAGAAAGGYKLTSADRGSPHPRHRDRAERERLDLGHVGSHGARRPHNTPARPSAGTARAA